MGMCLLSADLVTVGQSVHQAVKALGYVIDRASQFTSSTVITGRAERCGKFSVDCRWEARSCPKGTLLALNMRPVTRTLWSAVILFTVPSVLVVATSAYLIILGPKVVDSDIFLVLGLLLVAAIGWFLYSHKKWTRFLARKESEIWQALEQRYPCEKIIPVRTSLLGEKLETGIGLCSCLLIFVGCMRFAPTALLPIVLVLSVLLPYSAVSGWLRTKPFLQWRLQILDCLVSLAILSFSSLFFLYVFYVFFSVAALSSISAYRTPSFLLKQVMSRANYSRTLAVGATHPEKGVKEIAQNLIDKKVSELSDTFGASPDLLKHFRKLVTGKLVFVIRFITMLYLLLLSGALLMVLRAPWDWQEASGKAEPLPFRVPPVRLGESSHAFWQQAFLGIFLTSYGLINLVSLFVSAEILHFLFRGSTFLRPLGFVLAWISLPQSESMATVGNPSYAAHPFIGVVTLLMFAVPGLMIPASKISKLIESTVRGSWGKLKLLRYGYTISQSVQDVVRVLSLKAGIRTPLLKLLFDSKIRLFIRKRFWRRKARIYMTTAALEKLGPAELEAALAHEISHLQQGLFKIELARFLSWLFFFPNGCWHSLIDFVELEFDADMRAIRLTGKREPLVAALVKMSLDVNQQKSRKQVIGGKKRHFPWLRSHLVARRLMNEFLSGDVMVGYTYPHLTERIQTIQSQPV